MKNVVIQIFEDLDNYRDFCRVYGRKFNERDLYNSRSPYGDYLKWQESGKARWWPGYWDHRKPRPFNPNHAKKPYHNKARGHHNNNQNRSQHHHQR